MDFWHTLDTQYDKATLWTSGTHWTPNTKQRRFKDNVKRNYAFKYENTAVVKLQNLAGIYSW
jgi:hypothetical protein